VANSQLEGKVLGVIHVGAWVAEVSTALAREIMPEVTVLHITDDTIQWAVNQAMGRKGIAQENIPPFNYLRVATYCRYLQDIGAHAIVFGCSTMDRAAEYARPLIDIPIIAIDRPMMDKAVQLGRRIGLLATLDTTVPSSLRQLRNAAADAGKEIEIVQIFSGEAFTALRAGDRARHDELLVQAIRQHQDQVDAIAMAQISMSLLEKRVEQEGFHIPVLNSGREGLLKAREVLASR
jgi:Asp/Glu/hydantoin racemase